MFQKSTALVYARQARDSEKNQSPRTNRDLWGMSAATTENPRVGGSNPPLGTIIFKIQFNVLAFPSP